jgi:hypothetical protein
MGRERTKAGRRGLKERTERTVVKEVDTQQEQELIPTITPINNPHDLSFFLNPTVSPLSAPL